MNVLMLYVRSAPPLVPALIKLNSKRIDTMIIEDGVNKSGL
jgi:hypothetical protein